MVGLFKGSFLSLPEVDLIPESYGLFCRVCGPQLPGGQRKLVTLAALTSLQALSKPNPCW